MRKLEIVFTRSRKKISFISKAIMWYMGTDYSHVARRAYIGKHMREMYYQSSEHKVNYEYKDVFHKKHEIIAEYNILIEDDLYSEVADMCLTQAGAVYATMQNLGIVWVDICSRLGFKVKNPWKKGRNCSELIYLAVLKKLIPDLDSKYVADTINPRQIEDIIKANFKQSEDGIYRLSKNQNLKKD